MQGAQTGSLNSAKILRQDGSVETFSMCTRVRVAKGELIRLTTATGGGFGDPRKRPRERIASDLKNGFITPEQAGREYELAPAVRP